MTTPILSEANLSLAVVQLLRGVVYADSHAAAWAHLRALLPQVRDHMAVMGLDVVLDEAEGYAFVRQHGDGLAVDTEVQVPRLVPRRQLSYHVSLLLALLRKRLAEFDATDSGARCVVTREQIVDLVRVFLPSTTNEARTVEQVQSWITKVVDLGYLRAAGGDEYEIRRIIKAFVDAEWLADFLRTLQRAAAGDTGEAGTGASGDTEGESG